MPNKWMYNHDYRFGKESRVRLKPTVDPSIYGEFACVGNEGIIGDRRKDRFDLPEVYIQWDRNHWAYNGVDDCWTFEDHFELAEDNMGKREQINELTALFADGMARILGDEPGDEAQDTSQEETLTNRFLTAGQSFNKSRPQNDKRDEYDHAVVQATDELQGADAFIMVAVKRDRNGLLQPFARGYSRIPEGDMLITAHMGAVAAQAHRELALQTAAQLSE